MTAETYHVTVIGGGIVGLSTLWHLHRLGVDKLALMVSPDHLPASHSIPGIFSGGQSDNFTRLTHNFGWETASQLWRWGNHSFEALSSFCKGAGITVNESQRMRLVVTPDEVREVHVANEQLNQAGFPSELIKPASLKKPALTSQVEWVHVTGPSATIDQPLSLLEVLGKVPHKRWENTVTSLESQSGKMLIRLASGESLASEMVVCAAHLGIGDLIPELADALVPYCDQFHRVRSDSDLNWDLGTHLSWWHGLNWGACLDGHSLVLGGARLLRKNAGIEMRTPDFQERIAHYLGKEFANLDSGFDSTSLRTSTWSGIEILPCDEKPIVGPMFGNEKILVATGFGGQGLAQGFYAGACLGDFVISGKSERLPSALLPARLRSLA